METKSSIPRVEKVKQLLIYMQQLQLFNGKFICQAEHIKISAGILTVLRDRVLIRLTRSEPGNILLAGTYRWIGPVPCNWNELAEEVTADLAVYEADLRAKRKLRNTLSIVDEQIALDKMDELKALAGSPLVEQTLFEPEVLEKAELSNSTAAPTMQINAAGVLDLITRLDKYGVTNRVAFIEDYLANV
jgi:hypothetical protein